MGKVYLSRKDIMFTEHNVSNDVKARKTLLDMGYRTTPVMAVGDQVVVGYNPAKLDAALIAAGVIKSDD